MKTVFGVVVAIALLAGTEARATTLTFLNTDIGNGDGGAPLAAVPNSNAARASWSSFLTGVQTENFESLATGATLPLNLVNIPATLTGNGFVEDPSGPTNGSGRFPISGNKYFETGADQATSNFLIDFTTPVAAFGFYGIDIGDFPGTLTLQILRASGATQNFLLSSPGSVGGSVLFFGLIETDLNPNNWIDSVSFLSNNSTPGNTGGDFFGLDDLAVGTVAPVPEPTSLLLLGTGVVALARRRRTKNSE